MSPHSTMQSDPWIAALREMPSPGVVDPTMRHRVSVRLSEAVLGLVPAATAGSAHAVGSEHATNASGVAPAAGSAHAVGSEHATNASEVAPAASAMMRRTGGSLFAWLAPVFVAGAVSGWTADRWYLAHHEAPTVPSAAPLNTAGIPTLRVAAAASAVAIGAALVDTTMPEAAAGDLASKGSSALPASTSTAPAITTDSGMSLNAERQLLDAARTALSRGEPGVAIASLDKHARRYQKGTLTEEREALYVRVLVAAGKSGAAQARGAAFRKRFPTSIFLPVIDRALSSISRRNADDSSKP